IKVGPGRPRRKRRRDPFENPKKPASEGHHEATAQPTRIGRGGRVIRTGRGSGRGDVKGGRAGRGGRGGRTGRGGRAPQGIGVLIDEQGNAYTNVVGSTTGPRSIMEGESTQQSVNQ
ncbi:hypothetical protein KSS87_022193, partial [Heliosperma pusillum]